MQHGRRPLLGGLAATAALALLPALVPASATAAGTVTLRGVVVHARDGGSYVVAGSNGALLAVHGRAPAPGRRVVVRALPLRNGTHAARGVRVAGKAAARIQGVVTHVDANAGSLVVSSHGVSVLVQAAGVPLPAVGAHVTAGVDEGRSTSRRLVVGGLQTLASAPRATTVPLTGRVVRVDRARRLVVLGADDARATRRTVRLRVPKGLRLGALRSGRVVTASAEVSAPGAMTLTGSSGDTARGAASRSDDTGKGAVERVAVCHATSSGSYVQVTVPASGVAAHAAHAGDIVPAPATGCPTGSGTTPSEDEVGGTTSPGFGDPAAVCRDAGLPSVHATKVESSALRSGAAPLSAPFAGTVTLSGDADTIGFALGSGSQRADGAVVHAGAGQTVAVYDYAPDVLADTGLRGPLREGKSDPFAAISFVVLCSDGRDGAGPSVPKDPDPVPDPPSGPGGGPGPVTPPPGGGPTNPPAPTPAAPEDLHQHHVPVVKVEQHIDLEPGQTRTTDLRCSDGVDGTDDSGMLMTDGHPRIDHVDQGTGTRESVRVLGASTSGPGAAGIALRNDATGRAQAKAFGVCLPATTTPAPDGHVHALRLSDPVQAPARTWGPGEHAVIIPCPSGTLPVAPGHVVQAGDAALFHSEPTANGWELRFRVTDSATVAASVRCLDRLVGTTQGHRHELQVDHLVRTVTVPAGGVLETPVVCGEQAKGIVGSFSLPAGVVWLGDDPRPRTRVFWLLNTTGAPQSATVDLTCLGDRTGPPVAG